MRQAVDEGENGWWLVCMAAASWESLAASLEWKTLTAARAVSTRRARTRLPFREDVDEGRAALLLWEGFQPLTRRWDRIGWQEIDRARRFDIPLRSTPYNPFPVPLDATTVPWMPFTLSLTCVSPRRASSTSSPTGTCGPQLSFSTPPSALPYPRATYARLARYALRYSSRAEDARTGYIVRVRPEAPRHRRLHSPRPRGGGWCVHGGVCFLAAEYAISDAVPRHWCERAYVRRLRKYSLDGRRRYCSWSSPAARRRGIPSRPGGVYCDLLDEEGRDRIGLDRMGDTVHCALCWNDEGRTTTTSAMQTSASLPANLCTRATR
ncbi:hypothetical protein MSAN_00134300 [Mycena sanguinolenta]|uniref:Uncharacterized protein n=1 Tax=Mycena sanguinolenta TaxID=230812 RepID=A0A8H6ZGU1_9AGAR|nr:hypothetical protein MSAN_00134300 [Mycena sanguinolenta]